MGVQLSGFISWLGLVTLCELLKHFCFLNIQIIKPDHYNMYLVKVARAN